MEARVSFKLKENKPVTRVPGCCVFYFSFFGLIRASFYPITIRPKARKKEHNTALVNRQS